MTSITRKAWALVALGILLLVPVAVVYSDFADPFDSYANGTVSPGPWTFTTTNACITGQAELDVAGAQTPPNVYLIGGSGCSGAQTGTLAMSANASSTTITWTFYIKETTGTTTANEHLCGTSFSDSVSASWVQHTHTVTVAVGSTCSIDIGITTSSTQDLFIDTTYLSGANAIISGANLFLVDSVSGQWFNITDYPHSYVQLNVTGSTPRVYSPLPAPDINVNYADTDLLTVWVGATSTSPAYFAQIIPDHTSNNVFLTPRGTPATFYSLAVQDLTNRWGPGSIVKIYDGQNRTMRSGYTDSTNSFPFWLTPGTYQVFIISGSNTFHSTVNLPSGGGMVPVQILRVTNTGSCGNVCIVGTGAEFSSDTHSVIVELNDSSGTTVQVTDTLYKRNITGTFILYINTFSGTWGAFEDTISCNDVNCKIAFASEMWVQLTFHNGAGTTTTRLAVSASSGPGIFGILPAIPTDLLGWNSVFPSTATPLSFGAFFLVVMSASVSGAYSAKFGTVVVALLTAALAAANYLPLSWGLVTVIVAFAVMGFISYLRRSPG